MFPLTPAPGQAATPVADRRLEVAESLSWCQERAPHAMLPRDQQCRMHEGTGAEGTLTRRRWPRRGTSWVHSVHSTTPKENTSACTETQPLSWLVCKCLLHQQRELGA